MSIGFMLYGFVSIIGFSLLVAWCATNTRVQRREAEREWERRH